MDDFLSATANLFYFGERFWEPTSMDHVQHERFMESHRVNVSATDFVAAIENSDYFPGTLARRPGRVLLACAAAVTMLLSLHRCCHLAAAVGTPPSSIHAPHHTHTLPSCLTRHRELRFSNIPAPKRNRNPGVQRGYPLHDDDLG
jgi:hypothetical protein